MSKPTVQEQKYNILMGFFGRVYTPFAVYVWVAISLAAGFSGPFGTFTALSFPVRLGYWAVVVGVSILVGRVVRVTIEQRFENRPAWLVEVIALSTMVPILTAIVSVLTPLLLQVSPDRLPHPGTLAVYVLGIAGFVSAVRLARRHVPAVAEVTGGAPVAPACWTGCRVKNAARSIA
ncbi:MAG: hypothetical protein R3D85_03335 [Paracoccaceae bacterium]